MEYTGTYKVRREMHARPCTEVVQEIGKIDRNYKGLDFEARDPKSGKTVNCRSVLGLLTGCIGYNNYNDVEIVVSGNYPVDNLKKCADIIGGLFGKKDEYL